MDQLIGLLIFFAVINIVGRLLKSLAAGQKKPGAKPKDRMPEEHGRDLERELTRRIFGEEFAGETSETPAHPYETTAGEEASFDEETVAWPEDELEASIAAEAPGPAVSLPPELDEARFESGPGVPFPTYEGFPGELSSRGVSASSAPASVKHATTAGTGIGLLPSDGENLREAILLGTILGPCRARARARTPRRFVP